MFIYLLVLILMSVLYWPNHFYLLQMSLKALLLWENTHQCLTCSLACGTMRLTASHLGTNSALHIHTWNFEGWILTSHFASICLRWVQWAIISSLTITSLNHFFLILFVILLRY
jgi:hypothetical protein